MSASPLLLHVFPTFGIGGSQARFAAIANHFGGRYRHAIVALDGVYDCLDRLDGSVDAQRWDVPAPKGRTIPNVLAFRRILRTRKPDLLVTYNWGAIEWALANRPRIVPHIHIEDGFGPEEAERQLFRRRAGPQHCRIAVCHVTAPGVEHMALAGGTRSLRSQWN